MNNTEIPIKISDKAIKEAQKIFSSKNIPQEYGLRIAVKGMAGCGGASFIIGFDTEESDDNVFYFESLKVLISKKHYIYLIGQEVDFRNTNEERGFVFNKSIEL